MIYVRPWLGHIFAALAVVTFALMLAFLAIAVFTIPTRDQLFWMMVTILSLLLATAALSGVAFTWWMGKYDREAYARRSGRSPVEAREVS